MKQLFRFFLSVLYNPGSIWVFYEGGRGETQSSMAPHTDWESQPSQNGSESGLGHAHGPGRACGMELQIGNKDLQRWRDSSFAHTVGL